MTLCHATPRHATPRHATPRSPAAPTYLPLTVRLPRPCRRQVCIALPPGQNVNDGNDKVAQAWIRRIMKLDHATRNGLSLGGVYSDAYSEQS